MQSWSVIRAKGKTIPSGGTLVIGREQVRPHVQICLCHALVGAYATLSVAGIAMALERKQGPKPPLRSLYYSAQKDVLPPVAGLHGWLF